MFPSLLGTITMLVNMAIPKPVKKTPIMSARTVPNKL